MLSRTADHLFWMARYTERAENTARMLDVHWQTSLLPRASERPGSGWDGMLGISELTEAYETRYRDMSAQNVMHFMVRDEANVSSIVSCLKEARENARAVRGSITTELWETTNTTWLESRRLLAEGAFERDPSAVFEWVKFRSHLARGVALGTMLDDEAMRFIRVGTFLERGDNTARLLDVKFHALAGDWFGDWSDDDAPEADFYHWSAVLRSVSGFEIYRKVYRNVIRPDKVAELLMLRDDMPRSLAHCMQQVVDGLTHLANDQSAETQRRAGRLLADLRYARTDEILESGLHAFLTQFLDRINGIGAGISRDFLVND